MLNSRTKKLMNDIKNGKRGNLTNNLSKQHSFTSQNNSKISKTNTSSRCRILIVDHEIKTFLMHRIELAKALCRDGFDVHVALPQEPGFENVSQNDFSVHPYYLRRLSIRPFEEFRCFVSLFNLYKRIEPTLIHHFGLKPVLYGGNAARIAKIPAIVNTLTGLGYLYTATDITPRIIRKIVSTGLSFSFSHPNNRVIVQNLDDRTSLVVKSKIAKAKNAILIKGSGVDVSIFTFQPESVDLPVIMMAARLLWDKGALEFVEAARILRTKGIKARFLLVGEPDFNHPSAVPSDILNYWHDKGDVEWLGWRNDMPQLMKQCNIFCLPSYYGEGVPRSLLEAASVGRAIVTTNSLGCRDVVRHEYNGLIVPARNAEALANALIQLIQNPYLRKQMGLRSKSEVNKEFSLSKIIQEIKDVYTSLLIDCR